MKIGIIGAGMVGEALAIRLAEKEHHVLVANSRGPESVAESLKAPIANVTPSSASQTLACDLVFLTVPWTKIRDVLSSDGLREGGTLVDVTNIFLRTPPDALIDDLQGDSGSEIVARLAPKSHVVKAFNTLPFATIFTPLTEGMKRVLFVAGDDATAVASVADLIVDLGLHPVPLGKLANAGRLMELGGPLSGLELLTQAEAVA